MLTRATSVTVLLLAACGGEKAPPAKDAAGAADPVVDAAQAKLGDWGVETRFLDQSVDPGDDFYRHVNGGWLASAELPPGFSVFGSFKAVGLDTEEQIEAIVADILAKDWPVGSTEGQVKALYQSYMDASRLEELGVEPLQPELDAIFATKSHDDVDRFMSGHLSPSFPAVGVSFDNGNPERYVLIASQSGTTLPREFYVTDGEPYAGIIGAYQSYLEKLLTLAGIDEAAERAAAVVTLESRLAEASWTATEKRNKVRMYHPMPVDEFREFAPGVDWDARFDAAGFGNRDFIVVNTDTAVQKQAAIFADTPVETLQSFLAAHLLSNHASFLSSDFELAYFDFFERMLNGVDEQRPREKRAIEMLNALYGEPLGKLYVARYFPESDKQEVERMVGYMQAALRERLVHLQWMDDATRAEAIRKLGSFAVNIGYPDRWRNFSEIEYRGDDFFGNFRQYVAWNVEDQLAKLDLPNQRWEWLALPQIINAFYAPVLNSITFPAAIMQPPFFDPDADPAVNFGSIAVAIGHEIGHGFDDQGSQSDGTGALRNWWSDESRAEFENRAAQLAAQYDQYSPLEGVNLNGKLTLGENIGDLAGITVAYAAFKAYEQENYEDGAPVIDGFTGDQRFFLAFAQLWRDIATDQKRRQLALTDPHSPGQFRTNGVVRNFDPWYEAFDVAEDDDLYLPPEERVRIW